MIYDPVGPIKPKFLKNQFCWFEESILAGLKMHINCSMKCFYQILYCFMKSVIAYENRF
ncbi:hypothetical protein HanPI659440_Chr07g0258971 [Helianthus annuus]|nr:hypothetical protein HanPI659440_Chr07g0258971 [Helianthus annuus]